MSMRGLGGMERTTVKLGDIMRAGTWQLLKSGTALALCLVYVVYQIGELALARYILSALAILVFFLSLPGAKPVPRYFSLAMFAIGVGFYFHRQIPPETVIDGMLANIPLLSLTILVPLLSIPLKVGGYFDSVHFYLKKWLQNTNKLFTFITLFIFLLGPILNLGTLRVLHDMLKDLKLHPILLVKSYMTGFSTVIVWSPYFASVAMVLYYLNVPVLDYLPFGLGMAVLLFILGNLLFRFWEKRKNDFALSPPAPKGNPGEPVQREGEEHFHRKKIRILILLVIGLMGSVFFVESLTRWPMIFLVSLLSLVFPAGWLTFRRKWRHAVPHLKEYGEKTVPTFNNETVLFISAGWFGKSLMDTFVAGAIQDFLYGIASTSFLLFMFSIVCTMVLLTFLGVHPIVIVTVLLTQMHPEQIGTKPEVLALLIMVSWAVSAVASPVNPLNLLVSSATKQAGINVGVRWNGPYLVIILLLGMAAVYGLHRL